MTKPGTIETEHSYRYSPAEVWRALTTPELHAKWWAPGDVKPEVGHRFTLDMGEWGQQRCEVLEVEHEKRFRYLFAIGNLDTIITWVLTPEGTGTRLKLTHEGFNVDSPMGKTAFEGMQHGWPKVLERMEGALTS